MGSEYVVKILSEQIRRQQELSKPSGFHSRGLDPLAPYAPLLDKGISGPLIPPKTKEMIELYRAKPLTLDDASKRASIYSVEQEGDKIHGKYDEALIHIKITKKKTYVPAYEREVEQIKYEPVVVPIDPKLLSQMPKEYRPAVPSQERLDQIVAVAVEKYEEYRRNSGRKADWNEIDVVLYSYDVPWFATAMTDGAKIWFGPRGEFYDGRPNLRLNHELGHTQVTMPGWTEDDVDSKGQLMASYRSSTSVNYKV